MPTPQQLIFAKLHSELLKPLGFRKVSTRSEVTAGQLHQAVVCHSSRFNSSFDIDFTLELRVGHEAFFHLYRPGEAFPGLGEKSFMPLLSWRLTEENSSNDKWWHLRGMNEVEEVQEEVLQLFRSQGLWALEQTRTIEGIVSSCSTSSFRNNFIAWSWALHQLGQVAKARAVVHDAIHSAPHENARTYARNWLTKLDALPSNLDSRTGVKN